MMAPRSDRPWRFWLDVGGTFTDCVATSPSGERSHLKTLSSGVVKATVVRRNGDTLATGAELEDDVAGFWSGYECRLLNAEGAPIHVGRVASYDAKAVTLNQLPEDLSIASLEFVSNEPAPLVAIRRTLQLPLAASPPPMDIRLGTTRGTNALLTRSGARTGLVITGGFADLPLIGNQDRPELFRLDVVKPTPLHAATIEATERIGAEGEILTPLDEQALREQLAAWKRSKVESVAICFLNAYRNPSHELLAESIARDVGFEFVTLSHQVSALVKLVSRTDTSIVDAYLNPVLRRYVEQIESAISSESASQLRFLTSSGGLVSGRSFTGKDCILSGPAGGVVGFSRTSEAAGFDMAIGFDMGGTSTDVSRYSGRLERSFEGVKAGVRIVAPMLAIETVAAGGGSLCQFDGVRLTVGPESAGADPGPTCYGRGGPLAITDMNLWLGRLPTDRFPFPLDRDAVAKQLDELRTRIRTETGANYSRETLSQGFLQVANSNMAEAVRSISVAEGYDPRDYVLAAFGGAAPQHACSVADELGIERILIHPLGGVLSAVGAGMADVVRYAERASYTNVDSLSDDSLAQVFVTLDDEARSAVEREGADAGLIETVRWVDARYQGVDASLTLPFTALGELRSAFDQEHQRRFGYADKQRPLELVALRVEAVGRSEHSASPSALIDEPNVPSSPYETRQTFFSGEFWPTPVFVRDSLLPGSVLPGPSIVADNTSTVVVEPGWSAEVMSGGDLQLKRTALIESSATSEETDAETADPIQLELFNNRFAAIATQMGISLRATSTSVNVKERLDFSCALFAPDGGLIVNAPHIPVHLGAMSETVRCLLEDFPTMSPGDVYVTNDPYRGGSHLPDITVVTPVFDASHESLLFLTASRAHHSEIGGTHPGSMPPFSTNLAEEGVVLRGFRVINAGRARFDELRAILMQPPLPSRSPDQNLADIRAQVAANQQGAEALRALMTQFGSATVQAYMGHIQAAALTKVRRALSRITSGRRKFVDFLDCGARIEVAVDINDDCAVIDFEGTDTVLASNLNANRAIVTAAVMYCVRCLLDEDIPLNQGVLAPVQIRIPQDSLLAPSPGATDEKTPAVVGGNVETSQRVVDVLLGAFGLAAASQGTMNNVLFGDELFGYYETICGGCGATPRGDGADAVHSHMTNTRITDPEVFEQRLPARLLAFSIRTGSGGSGRYRGGDGVIRRIEFLKGLDLSLLTQRRGPYAPYGMQGGSSGQVGVNQLQRRDGATEDLPASAAVRVQAGDQLTIKTPGGGGWGRPE